MNFKINVVDSKIDPGKVYKILKTNYYSSENENFISVKFFIYEISYSNNYSKIVFE
jgi:hypothetical protein